MKAPADLPASGPAREAIRRKGQFWTPPWLAEVMVRWVLAEAPHTLFDPATGPGAFLAAARRAGFRGRLAGFELDPSVLAKAPETGLTQSDLADIMLGDFLADATPRAYPAIISNPPYIRHHRLARSESGNCARWRCARSDFRSTVAWGCTSISCCAVSNCSAPVAAWLFSCQPMSARGFRPSAYGDG